MASSDQSGFTLTELLVAIAAASGLIVAIGQMLALSARAYGRVTTQVEHVRALRALGQWATMAENADPDLVTVQEFGLSARRGEQRRIQIQAPPSGANTGVGVSVMQHEVQLNRIHFANEQIRLVVSGGNGIELVLDGQIIVSQPVLRQIPYDCRFDTVAKSCR